MAEAYDAYRAGRLDAFYAPLVVEDDGARGGSRRRHVRDRHPSARRAARPRVRRSRTRPPARDGEPGSAVEDAALFAAEYTALGEADVGASFGARIDELEARLGRLERAPPRVSAASPEACVRDASTCARLLAFVPTGGRRSSSSWSRSASSGSRRSAGRWRRGGTPGTTSSTTSSSSTPSPRSRRCSSSALR